MLLILRDFRKAEVRYRCEIDGSGTVLDVTQIRKSEPRSEETPGFGLFANFRPLKGKFVALYQFPSSGQSSGATEDRAAHKILCIGDQAFDLDATGTTTSFAANFLRRKFFVTSGDGSRIAVNYFPPLAWTAFDHTMYKYYDIFWMAYVDNHHLRPI
jgi:hypothetical protein